MIQRLKSTELTTILTELINGLCSNYVSFVLGPMPMDGGYLYEKKNEKELVH